MLTAVVKPKLPRIELPKFSGDVTILHSFWESFKSSVQNTGLSVIDKFNYLHTLLERSTVHAIQGLALTEGNYNTAIGILKERFGKSQQSYMKDFWKIPVCTNDKPSQLLSLYDKINVNVHGLEALGMGVKECGSFLILIVIDWLPADVCLQIARATTKEIWEIDEVLEVLRTEIEAREISDKIKVTENHNPLLQSQPKNHSVNSIRIDCTWNGKSQCILCLLNENHYSASCGKVTGTLECRHLLRKEGQCFLCLIKSHRDSECQGNKRCCKCGRKPH